MSTCDGESASDRATCNHEHQTHGAAPSSAASELLDSSKQFIREALNLLSPDEVTDIFGRGTPHPASLVDGLRADGQLIGFPYPGSTYQYPAFQIDMERHRVHPLVAHANRALRADRDPYGVASWWITPTDILDGRCPLDELIVGTLTIIAIDNVLDLMQSEM
ncbi:hypothetical protein [Prescottella equi]|uniref:hypothetical protein n=1 Tax=Rhodococcus hoagii TaxID=43767 RepID=UPI000A11F535|nr:hypothetical protein [Prescottella equi]ORL76867.1 hypothetical protein A5905_18060 [Prescottella equi]